jgi:transketolase
MENRENTIEKLEDLARRMRRHALDMALHAPVSHLGGGLSIVDIVATLYGGVMRVDPQTPEWPERDRFILSKGHGVLGYYPALAELGFFPEEELLTFEQSGTALAGHPVMDRAKGLEFSSGSLGMGLSLGIGVALAGRRRGADFRVYVLLGDGECNEGSVWEAAMAAAHFELENIVAIVDNNRLQLGGAVADVMNTGSIADKWRSFGWSTREVDGHDVGQLYDVFRSPPSPGKPTCVVARTVKGKGISFAEDNNDWHHAVLTKKQHAEAVEALALQKTTPACAHGAGSR